MKTQKNNSLGVLAILTVFASIILLGACRGKGEASQNGVTDSTAASRSAIKPPQMDIHTAVLTGNLEALQQHIAAGTNLNEKDPFGGSSPLITAALFGKTAEARTLIEAGADLNFQNKDGSTALHTAAFFCRPEIVRMLLDKGADKTIKNNFGATAYTSVAGSFGDAKNTYDMMGKILGPMGLTLDYAYIEKTRPAIAAMLK